MAPDAKGEIAQWKGLEDLGREGRCGSLAVICGGAPLKCPSRPLIPNRRTRRPTTLTPSAGCPDHDKGAGGPPDIERRVASQGAKRRDLNRHARLARARWNLNRRARPRRGQIKSFQEPLKILNTQSVAHNPRVKLCSTYCRALAATKLLGARSQ